MSTLQQLRADVQLLLLEQDKTHFTPAELNGFINRAVEITALLSETATDSIEFTAEYAVGGYTLPSDNVLIKNAYFGDKNTLNDLKPLDIYVQETLRNINPYWLDETTSSLGQPKRLLLLDRVTVFLDPRPNTEFSTNKKLILYYIFQPTAMSQDSQQPNIALGFHSMLKFYALYLCYLALKNVEMSTKAYNDYIAHYKLLSQTLTKGADEVFRFHFNFKEE